MKKIIVLCLCFFVVMFCFMGCRYILTTEEYELYDKFARRHDAGMTKQEVLDKLGPPVWYVGTDGIGYSVSADTQEEFEANIFSNQYVRWVYICEKTDAYNSHYQLDIYFDSEGKSTEARIFGYS